LYKKAGKNPMHVFIPLVQDFTLLEKGTIAPVGNLLAAV